MAKKTLTEAFEVKSTQTPKKNLRDYDIFGDKGLLDSLRTKIVQNLIEENIPDDGLLEDYINNEIKPIDSSISQCNKMISLLQERKQIIINDVVTGKVKVI